MSANWSPPLVEKDDRVFAPLHPDWGEGIVLDAQCIGEMRFQDGTIFQLSRKSVGQRLVIRFSDGRTRTILSSSTRIEKASYGRDAGAMTRDAA